MNMEPAKKVHETKVIKKNDVQVSAKSPIRGKRLRVKKSEQLDQLVLGLSIYNQQNGIIYAASATMWTIFCFFPLLLIGVKATALLSNSKDNPFEVVYKTLNGVFPSLNPWVKENLSHLSMDNNISILNGASLLLLSVGLIGLVVCLKATVRNFTETKVSSSLKELLKTYLTASLVVLFFVVLFPLSHNPTGFIGLVYELDPDGTIFYLVDNYPLTLPSIFSLTFFSALYYFLIPYRIRVSDALMGATIFTGIFYVLKTVSWLYIHYFAKDFNSLFGTFGPAFMAIFWTFLLMNCLFISLSVALSPGHRRAKILAEEIKGAEKKKKKKTNLVKVKG